MYEKIKYEDDPCYCGNKLHRQVVVVALVDGVEKREAVDFHLTKAAAIANCARLNEQLEHEKTVPVRWSWYWDSKLTPQRRRQIDVWYNSLTAEQREMLDDIVTDAREEATDPRD